MGLFKNNFNPPQPLYFRNDYGGDSAGGYPVPLYSGGGGFSGRGWGW